MWRVEGRCRQVLQQRADWLGTIVRFTDLDLPIVFTALTAALPRYDHHELEGVLRGHNTNPMAVIKN